MFTLTAQRPDGERLTLTQYHSAYRVKYSGFGPVAASVATSAMGHADGDKINSKRRGKRNALLTVYIGGNAEQNRIRLYSFFTPGHTVRLYYRNGARDVYTEGVVETFECDQFSSPMYAQISIVCPSPYWTGAEEIVKDISGVVSLFSFPFAIEEEGVELSSLTGSDYAVLENAGDEPAGFIASIYARAAVTAPMIYNIMTNEAFRLKGVLEQGYTLTICTITGSKRVTITSPDGQTTNALHRMQAGSTWLQLTPGSNYISYAAESGAAAMMVSLRHNNLFVGV